MAAKVRGAQAGLGLLRISGRGSDHSSLRLVPLEPSPDSPQATPAPPPPGGGQGGRCPARDELVAPRGLRGAHPAPPFRSPIGGSSSAPTPTKPTRSVRERGSHYLLLPPESGSGSDVRGKVGAIMVPLGRGEAAAAAAVAGSRGGKRRNQTRPGLGTSRGARDLGSLLKHFPVGTLDRSP